MAAREARLEVKRSGGEFNAEEAPIGLERMDARTATGRLNARSKRDRKAV
jgi:hypothetical protein